MTVTHKKRNVRRGDTLTPHTVGSSPYPAPLLKWLGGKTQLLEAITPLVPVAIRNYHEPFVGGGSVLFAVLRMAAAGRVRISGGIYASDNNRALIAFYKHVQARPRPLYKLIRTHFDAYNAIPQLKSATKRTRGIAITTAAESRQSKEAYYYWLRDTYNTHNANLAPTTSLRTSALFYAMNKLDFRGLYRESRAGVFNAAFGHYASAPECTCDTFVNASRLIRPVVFARRLRVPRPAVRTTRNRQHEVVVVRQLHPRRVRRPVARRPVCESPAVACGRRLVRHEQLGCARSARGCRWCRLPRPKGDGSARDSLPETPEHRHRSDCMQHGSEKLTNYQTTKLPN
jgi:DNA adenine methylase Dam